MRVAVISDIHGNMVAFEAVLQDLAQQAEVDHLVIAGDLCLNGPRPRQVLKRVQKLNCPVVQGNVDTEVVHGAPDKSAKKRATIDWTREQIGKGGIEYLASLPHSYTVTNPHGSDLLVFHANPLDQEEAIFPDTPDTELERLLGGVEPNVEAIAFGHLHSAYTRHWRRLLLADVGSCGLPRDEDRRASYGILSWKDTGWEAEIRRVEYDVQAVIKQMEMCGMPNGKKRIKVLLEATY